MKRGLGILLKVAFIALLFRLAPSLWDDLDVRKLQGWWWIALAQVLVAAMLFLSFYRWKLLLTAQEIDYSMGEAMALGFIGFFFSQFIPGSIGGDLVKAYYLAVDHPERKAAGITTVFLDRVAGLLVLMVIAGVAIVLNWSRIASDPILRALATCVGVALLLAVGGGSLFFSSRLRSHPRVQQVLAVLPLQDLLRKVQRALYVYRFHPRLVLLAVFLSLLVQLSVVVMGICYAMALGYRGEIASFFFIIPMVQIAMSIPIGMPGGVGQSELASKYLFRLVNFHDGFELAVIQRLNWWLWAIPGCIYYAKRRGRVRRALELAQSENEASLGEGTQKASDHSSEAQGSPAASPARSAER